MKYSTPLIQCFYSKMEEKGRVKSFKYLLDKLKF